MSWAASFDKVLPFLDILYFLDRALSATCGQNLKFSTAGSRAGKQLDPLLKRHLGGGGLSEDGLQKKIIQPDNPPWT